MQRASRSSSFLVLAVTAVIALNAQQGSQRSTIAPAPRNTFLLPFIPPVSDAPLTATLAITVERPLPDGHSETLTSTARVARNALGQTRHEQRALVPASFTAAPPLLNVILFDPHSRIIEALDASHRTGSQRQLRPAADTNPAPDHAEDEDLGIKIVHGFTARGTRRVWTVPAQLSPSGETAEAFDETWYSSDLQMVVFERRTNPFGGVEEIVLSDIDRGEPSAALFKAPRDYRVVEQGRTVNASADPVPSQILCSVMPASHDPHDPYSSPAPCSAGFAFAPLPR